MFDFFKRRMGRTKAKPIKKQGCCILYTSSPKMDANNNTPENNTPEKIGHLVTQFFLMNMKNFNEMTKNQLVIIFTHRFFEVNIYYD
ncbi:hypothetical protein BGP_2237 [Beggiatoa sp. PS]|nr:hypothetical protein BGP_2237 [Beggiatoa sp. PS]